MEGTDARDVTPEQVYEIPSLSSCLLELVAFALFVAFFVGIILVGPLLAVAVKG